MEHGFGSPDYGGTRSAVIIKIDSAKFSSIKSSSTAWAEDVGNRTHMQIKFLTDWAKEVLVVDGDNLAETINIEFRDNTGIGIFQSNGLDVYVANTSNVHFDESNPPTAAQLAWRIAWAINNAGSDGGTGYGRGNSFRATVAGIETPGDVATLSAAGSATNPFWGTSVKFNYPTAYHQSMHSSTSIGDLSATTLGPPSDLKYYGTDTLATVAYLIITTKMIGSSNDYFVTHPVTGAGLAGLGGLLIAGVAGEAEGIWDIAVDILHPQKPLQTTVNTTAFHSLLSSQHSSGGPVSTTGGGGGDYRTLGPLDQQYYAQRINFSPGSFELVSGFDYRLIGKEQHKKIHAHAPQKWLHGMWSEISAHSGNPTETKYSDLNKLTSYDWGFGGTTNTGAGSLESTHLVEEANGALITHDTAFGSPYVDWNPVYVGEPQTEPTGESTFEIELLEFDTPDWDVPVAVAYVPTVIVFNGTIEPGTVVLDNTLHPEGPTQVIQDSGGVALQIYGDSWPVNTRFKVQFRVTGATATFPQGDDPYCSSGVSGKGTNIYPIGNHLRFVSPVLPPGVYDIIVTAPDNPVFQASAAIRAYRVVRRTRNTFTFRIRSRFSSFLNVGSRRFNNENLRLGGGGK